MATPFQPGAFQHDAFAIPGGVSSGAIGVELLESAILSDALVGGIGYAATEAESATLTDFVSGWSIGAIAQSESATATDPQAGDPVIGRTLDESATPSEDTATLWQVGSPQTEFISSSADTYARTSTATRTLSESVTATDGLTDFTSIGRPLAETAQPSVTTDESSTVAKTISASATATDALGRAATKPNTYLEQPAATDAAVARQVFTGSLAESVTATDQVVKQTATEFGDSQLEPATLSEVLDSAVGVSSLDAVLAETVAATDSYTRALEGDFVVGIVQYPDAYTYYFDVSNLQNGRNVITIANSRFDEIIDVEIDITPTALAAVQLAVQLGATGTIQYATVSTSTLSESASTTEALSDMQLYGGRPLEAATATDAYVTSMVMHAAQGLTASATDADRVPGGDVWNSSQVESIGGVGNGLNFKVWNGSTWV